MVLLLSQDVWFKTSSQSKGLLSLQASVFTRWLLTDCLTALFSGVDKHLHDIFFGPPHIFLPVLKSRDLFPLSLVYTGTYPVSNSTITECQRSICNTSLPLQQVLRWPRVVTTTHPMYGSNRYCKLSLSGRNTWN